MEKMLRKKFTTFSILNILGIIRYVFKKGWPVSIKSKAMVLGDAVQLSGAFLAIGANAALFSDAATGAGGFAAGLAFYAAGLALTARSFVVNQTSWEIRSETEDNPAEPACLMDALLAARKRSKSSEASSVKTALSR